MTTKYSYTCDFCGKEIEFPEKSMIVKEYKLFATWREIDLCKTCIEQIKEISRKVV